MIKKVTSILFLTLLFGCYSTKWNSINNSNNNYVPAPNSILEVFNRYPNKVISLDATAPGFSYKYDIAEKDLCYGDSISFKFTKVNLALHDKMPEGKIITDFTFIDKNNNELIVPNVDLLRLTPKFDAVGDVIYPEIIEEEFNRFGYTFRKEHNEFAINLANPESKELSDAKNRAYRCQIINNCLGATKWEFAVTTEDYSNFNSRLKGDENLNQNRMLSHSWFYLDKDLYTSLIHLKNPDFKADLNISYNDMSSKAEQVAIDFKKLREPVKYRAKTELLEVGHKTNRPLEMVDNEQFFKKEFNLLLEGNTETYASVLETPLKTAQFKDEGVYKITTPREFDLKWMKHLDSVHVDVLDVKGSSAYVELTLTGQWTPYKINIGNIDLSLLNEQKLSGLLFGINTYPKSRRYNPVQNTLVYDAELVPNDIKPYLWLTQKDNNKWVNNQYRGVDKVYLTYETMEQDVLLIYVLSYERITPIWMARVKLPKELREKVRIRKKLYNY